MADSNGLYVLMLSIHGLVRGDDIELGRDADTGGQVKYVIEQARALVRHPRVERVDLLTRQVIDRKVDPIYAEPLEMLADGAHLARIPCGPRRYLYKERLWPHLDSFLDGAVAYIRRVGRVPDLVHGHYADAGYVAAKLATLLGVPMVFTGHSLGRVKRERLLEKGQSSEALERKFNFRTRIEAEERALETASLVITSTSQEVQEQYELYDHYQPERMNVIPPGVALDRFSPPREGEPRPPIARQIERFLRDPDKPLVFAMARADERKNFPTLIEAYARDPKLREMANLLLVAGNREDIQQMDPAPRRVLDQILHLVDRYDLYGSAAYPKHHEPDEVPDLYREATRSRGVFVNPALTEPFGLTLIEAAASGLPLVSTDDGGPKDIVGACRNGRLVDPLDPVAMGKAIRQVLSDPRRWEEYSRRGLEGARRHFSWKSHVDSYVSAAEEVTRSSSTAVRPAPPRRTRLITLDRALLTDIDNTLTGDREAQRVLFQRLEEAGDGTVFGIATGRDPGAALQVLEEIEAPHPEILITCVGTEIYYGRRLTRDTSWLRQIDFAWDPDRVRAALDELPGLHPQEDDYGSHFKVSYDYDPEEAPSLRKIRRHLRKRGLRVRPILSLQAYLDVVPIRASPGQAIRFLGLKWGLPPERVLIAGDSGNDEDMLSGNTLGVVVGNHGSELESLRGRPRIYFAEGHHAWGILEGIDHYDFLGRIRIPEEEDE